MLDNGLTGLFVGFSAAEIENAGVQHERELAALGQARAINKQHRVDTRRVTSDEQLAELVPARIEAGHSCHVLSSGKVDVLSFTRHLLAGAGWLAYVLITTWRINRDDLEQFAHWLNAGLIERFDLVIDLRFARLSPDEYRFALELARKYGGFVTLCRNHTKITLASNPQADIWYVLESSANVNTNLRLEQTAIHNCRALFDFYREAFDAIRQNHA